MKKIIVAFIVLFILTGCGNYAELNELAITTGLAIDYKDGKYNVSTLIANSKKAESSAKEGEAQTTVYSGSGKTIMDAINEIDKKNPKNIYIGHLSIVVVSKEVAEKGVLEIADFLLRNAESRKRFYFIISKDTDAKDILSTVMPLESFPSHGIATLVRTASKTQALTSPFPYSKFIAKVLNEGTNPTLPSIEIMGNKKKKDSPDILKKTDIKTYLKLSGLGLFRDDKFIDYANEVESQTINILNKDSNSLILIAKIDDSKMAFNITDIKPKLKLISPNEVVIDIKGKADIMEINNKMDLESSRVILEIEKSLNKNITRRINDTIDSLQNKYEVDALSIGNLIYQKYPDYWEEYKKDWDKKGFKKVKFRINNNIKIVSTGSLKQTIKEAK